MKMETAVPITGAAFSFCKKRRDYAAGITHPAKKRYNDCRSDQKGAKKQMPGFGRYVRHTHGCVTFAATVLLVAGVLLSALLLLLL